MNFLFVVKSKAIETLGPMYLSAVIKEAGHNCHIIDIDKAWKYDAYDYIDTVCYSVMTGDQQKFIDLNAKIKEEKPKMFTIVGGPHPTFFPDDFKDTGIDHIVKGEAENWIADFIGVDQTYGISNLDNLPFPDRTDFPDRPIRDFISSRGCPFDCRYCFNHQWKGMYPDIPKVRTRSVRNVIQEIKEVKPKFVYFQDSCFGVSMEWTKNFCTQYIRDIQVPFHCHLRPNQVNQERVDFLRLANCVSVRFALETASDELRKLIGRAHTTNEESVKAAGLLREGHIKFMIQNMLALPTSTIEDDLETLEVNIRCQPDYAWSSIFSPFPGTDLGDECKEKGWYTGDYSDITDCFFDRSILEFDELYKEQTYCLQKVFALAVETQTMPEIEELMIETVPQFIHRALRRVGDNRIYGGVI